MKGFLVIVTAAFMAGTINAGFASGECPPVKSLAYDKSMSEVIDHYLLYIDKSTYTYVQLA